MFLCNYLMYFVHEVTHGHETLPEGVYPFILTERLRIYKVFLCYHHSDKRMW